MAGKYLEFVEVKDTGKTKVFAVRSVEHDIVLGHISWYGAWRKYVFAPGEQTIFDAVCLSDITDFVNELMRERKEAKRGSSGR